MKKVWRIGIFAFAFINCALNLAFLLLFEHLAYLRPFNIVSPYRLKI